MHKKYYPKSREKIIAKSKQYYEENKEAVLEKARIRYRANPERKKEIQKKSVSNNIERYRNYQNNYKKQPHIRKKEDVRYMTRYHYGSAQVCGKCGSTERVQHHHPAPYRVHVFEDLCEKCHRKIGS